MPANSILQATRHTEWLRQRWTLRATIARNITQPSPGEWFLLECIHRWTVTVDGDFNGVARLLGCNNAFDDRPDDADVLQPALSVDYPTAFTFDSDAPYAWIKLYVPLVNTGTIRSARLWGVERPGT